MIAIVRNTMATTIAATPLGTTISHRPRIAERQTHIPAGTDNNANSVADTFAPKALISCPLAK